MTPPRPRTHNVQPAVGDVRLRVELLTPVDPDLDPARLDRLDHASTPVRNGSPSALSTTNDSSNAAAIADAVVPRRLHRSGCGCGRPSATPRPTPAARRSRNAQWRYRSTADLAPCRTYSRAFQCSSELSTMKNSEPSRATTRTLSLTVDPYAAVDRAPASPLDRPHHARTSRRRSTTAERRQSRPPMFTFRR